MEKVLHLLKTFTALGSDGRTHVVDGYEHLARPVAVRDASGQWEPTGVCDDKLAEGHRISVGTDGVMTLASTTVPLVRNPTAEDRYEIPMKALSIPVIDRDDYERLQSDFGLGAFPLAYEEHLSQTRAAADTARQLGRTWCPQSVWFADFIWFCASAREPPNERLLWAYAGQLQDEASGERPPELQ